MKSNFTFVLVITCFLVSVSCVKTALADVPIVNGIVVWTRPSDSHTILNITLTHHNYFTGHYVDWIKVNVSGIINTVNLSEPQPDSTFTVQYDFGLVSDTPSVQVLANCNIHGSSAWSETVIVPEFTAICALSLLITLVSAVLIAQNRKRIR